MRHFVALLCLISLAGCAGSVSRLREINPQANDYPTALASEYQAYADSESEQGRLFSAEHFAGKGLKALKGEKVEPDPVDEGLKEDTRVQLSIARAELLKYSSDQIKSIAPQKAARAQLLFDCWQHELSQHLDQEKAPCGAEFRGSIAELVDVSDDLLYDTMTPYKISFAKGSAKLGANAEKLIKNIAKRVVRKKHYDIEVRGRNGAAAGALELTENRLLSVSKALVKHGIPQNHIVAINEDDSKKIFLSRDEAPQDSNKITITVKTRSSGGSAKP